MWPGPGWGDAQQLGTDVSGRSQFPVSEVCLPSSKNMLFAVGRVLSAAPPSAVAGLRRSIGFTPGLCLNRDTCARPSLLAVICVNAGKTGLLCLSFQTVFREINQFSGGTKESLNRCIFFYLDISLLLLLLLFL